MKLDRLAPRKSHRPATGGPRRLARAAARYGAINPTARYSVATEERRRSDRSELEEHDVAGVAELFLRDLDGHLQIV